MKIVVGGIELSFGPEMIERVLAEWEAEHPGCHALEMTPDEFARRMMIEIRAGARRVAE
jgi:hypothetical protein